MTPLTVSQLRNEFADREAIRDCMYRYCRGMDRLDADLLRSAYWPDAIDHHHSDFRGTIDEFIAWSFPMMKNMDQSIHIIGNILIRLDGPKAQVESYFYGIHRLNADGTKRCTFGAGRYVDRFERRNDEWRIAHRVVVTDFRQEHSDANGWSVGPLEMPGAAAVGVRSREDVSYTGLSL